MGPENAGSVDTGKVRCPVENDRGAECTCNGAKCDSTDAFASFQAQDPQFKLVEKITGWIVLAILVVIAFVFMSVLAVGMSPIGPLYWSLMILCIALLALIGWCLQAYPAAAHRNYRWRFGEQGLEIKRGVWFRQEVSVPRARVQHTDVHQGPLLRKFGLAKLIVHTAGTRDATVELEGLNIETARSLRDHLVNDTGVTNSDH
jgi:uncharacterized protein